MLNAVLNKRGEYGVYLEGNSLKVDFPYRGVGKKVICKYFTLVFYCPLHDDIEVIPERGDPYFIYIERKEDSQQGIELKKLDRVSLIPLIEKAFDCGDLELLIWLRKGPPSLYGWLEENRGMPPKWVFRRVPKELRGFLVERIRRTRPLEELTKVIPLFL